MAKAKSQAALTQLGADDGVYLNHATPEMGAKVLWPATMGEAIQLKRIASYSSADLMAIGERQGAVYNDYSIALYSSQSLFGNPRKLDNSDWTKGKDQLYSTTDAADGVRRDVEGLVGYLKDLIGTGTLLSSMEDQDLKKVTAQQWKQPGWFLQNPITEHPIPELSARAKDVMKRVVFKYASVIKDKLRTPLIDLSVADTDPPDTMTGAPAYMGGSREQTMLGRLLTMACTPVPVANPEDYARALLLAGDEFGLPEPLWVSPVVSTRHGPIKKPQKLWYQNGPDAGFTADWEAVSLYDRTRLVYPAPYAVNFLLSPIYKLCTYARQGILGLWNSPEYIDR